MACFLLQWAYKDPQIKAMIDKPQYRTAVTKKVTEVFQGKLRSFFFAFGACDGAAITAFPDNESAVASLLSTAGASFPAFRVPSYGNSAAGRLRSQGWSG